MPYKRCTITRNDEKCLGQPYSGYSIPKCDKNDTTCGNTANLYEDSICSNVFDEYPTDSSACARSFKAASLSFATGVNCSGITPNTIY